MSNRLVSWRFVILIAALLLAGCVVIIGSGRTALNELEAQKVLYQQDRMALLNREARLMAELEKVATKGYIESRARTEYAFINPGEIRYMIANPENLDCYTAEEWKQYLQYRQEWDIHDNQQ